MKYKTTITKSNGFDINQTVLKLDEFLKDYWGSEKYYIIFDNDIEMNTDIFENNINFQTSFSFFGFIEKSNFLYLQEHDYSITPLRTEIFRFLITTNYLEINFYNSFTTNEREKQFYKIIENIKTAITKDLPLIRLKVVNDHLTDVRYKYRKREGKVGFKFSSSNKEESNKYEDSIFIYWSDFEYLRPYIYQIYPKDDFDNTSWNTISKSDWIKITDSLKNYNTDGNLKLSAFYNYIIQWSEAQLASANYIDILGTL